MGEKGGTHGFSRSPKTLHPSHIIEDWRLRGPAIGHFSFLDGIEEFYG